MADEREKLISDYRAKISEHMELEAKWDNYLFVFFIKTDVVFLCVYKCQENA